jgi:hypothetical protein
MRFVVFCVAAALTVNLVPLGASTASAQSNAQSAKKKPAQNRAANAPSVNECISLAMQRGFSVGDMDTGRGAARNFVLACLQGKQR